MKGLGLGLGRVDEHLGLRIEGLGIDPRQLGLVHSRAFGDCCARSFTGLMPSSHPPNSVKALKESILDES